MTPPVPTGNTFDKYGSTHPVVRRLMAGFERDLWALLERAGGARIASVLDVGCGEGVLTQRIAARIAPGPVLGVDLEDPGLAAHWGARAAAAPNLEFAVMEADALSPPDDAFELVCATEVLEHLPDPQGALSQMARVAARWLLVSVPHEPLWRALNLARGAYVRALGNTPGHLNHWTRAGFVSLLEAHGEVTEVRTPFPWTMLLVRVG
jgi:SAM-dependent methyltransferase